MILIKFLQTGAISVDIMYNETTDSIVTALLQLEETCGTRIMKCVVDAGKNLLKHNLHPVIDVGGTLA